MWCSCSPGEHGFNSDKTVHSMALSMSLPVVVKPCSGGSSISVYIAETEEEYNKAVEESFRYEDRR